MWCAWVWCCNVTELHAYDFVIIKRHYLHQMLHMHIYVYTLCMYVWVYVYIGSHVVQKYLTVKKLRNVTCMTVSKDSSKLAKRQSFRFLLPPKSPPPSTLHRPVQEWTSALPTEALWPSASPSPILLEGANHRGKRSPSNSSPHRENPGRGVFFLPPFSCLCLSFPSPILSPKTPFSFLCYLLSVTPLFYLLHQPY